MSIERRVRWWLIRLGRGDIDAAPFEGAALYIVMLLLLAGFVLLIGEPVLQPWIDFNDALARVSSGKG